MFCPGVFLNGINLETLSDISNSVVLVLSGGAGEADVSSAEVNTESMCGDLSLSQRMRNSGL